MLCRFASLGAGLEEGQWIVVDGFREHGADNADISPPLLPCREEVADPCTGLVVLFEIIERTLPAER